MANTIALPVVQPTAFVVPDRFSYSSLQQLRECPRRWQLLHAHYGAQVGYPEAFTPVAERGRMVHRLVSLLFRTMSAAGNPAPGSAAFQAAARELNPLGRAALLLEEGERKLAAHPRSRGQRLRFTPIEIYSAASLLFQREYRPSTPAQRPPTSAASSVGTAPGRSEQTALQESLGQRLLRWGSLQEKSLVHPDLPLYGIVDLLLQGERGAIVVDFKTGAPRPSHREQVQLYALLWWRQEGSLPERGELRYGARVDEVDVGKSTLVQLEDVLAKEIADLRTVLASEAIATPGDHCARCPVRPLCERYWQETALAADWVDAEIVIEGQDALGFRGTLPSGLLVRVLLPPASDGLRAELSAGAKTRWLGLHREESTNTLACTPQTEVFLVRPPSS